MEVHGVEFQDDEFVRRKPLVQESVDSLSQWLIRTKIAKSPIQANGVLLVVIVICIAGAIAAALVGGREPVGPTAQEQALFDSMNPGR